MSVFKDDTPLQQTDFLCADSLNRNYCFLLCRVCSVPEFMISIMPDEQTKFCSNFSKSLTDDGVLAFCTGTFMRTANLNGYYFLDDPSGPEVNGTVALQHLLAYMPRRDLIPLSAQPLLFIDFLFEHVRYALLARAQFPFAQPVPWEVFLDTVLPYAVVNEHRDWWWRWRPRLYQVRASFFLVFLSSLLHVGCL